ncbi:monomeric [FeFe] hydrogenase [Porphyromonadaceae bacterium OttesenSCG-928-L07]|nr:monomeric [FeFe] hydrogenase [Porphyromonadaceae bacterium OttesenSCG-928-L07]MDL2330797.1 monomeric [FeFe] hydrogenase [Odoribacter sp. OttesenSCG-928-A06]
MLTKRELLIRIVKLLKEDNLVDGVKHIPIEMRPKSKRPVKCCVHKDRYILKHKIISILGFDITDEEIDLIPLAEFAEKALKNKNSKENILSVVHEACSACMQSQYFVTNMCRGCEGRPCLMNCPKAAISFKGGKANITQEDCVSCGLCLKVCPYHAIVFTPVPCEDACPVKAIYKSEDGTEKIDKDKCIYCGKCMQACPYGAIMERSKVIDVHKCITDPKKKIIAIPAPAIYGQFDATPGQILSAIKSIGFDEVVEVALGAEDTSRNESNEFLERMHEGQPFMTTSCCPAYVRWTDMHAPMIKPFVSDTRSPMVYAAKRVKEKYPDAEVVFIGPCLAKRSEADSVPEVDYVMSFEELGAFMVAYNINVGECEEAPLDPEVTRFSRGYAQAGGVRNAILNAVGNGYTTLSVEGLDKKNQNTLKAMVKKPEAQFVEVMACEGGCVNGPCSLAPLPLAKRQIKKALE